MNGLTSPKDQHVNLVAKLGEYASRTGVRCVHDLESIEVLNRSELAPFGRLPWYYRTVARGSVLFLQEPSKWLVGLTASWAHGINHCLDGALIVVRPEFADPEIASLCSTLQALAETAGSRLIVKQLQKDAESEFASRSFRHYAAQEGWRRGERLDDQTFPEVVLDAKAPWPASNQLARSDAARRVKNSEILIETGSAAPGGPIIPSRREVFREVFNKWLKDFHRRHQNRADAEFLEWNIRAVETVFSEPGMEFVFVSEPNECDPFAAFAVAASSDQQLDVYLAFHCASRENMHRVAYWYLRQWAFEQNYHWLNLGGSERRSLFDFKTSLGPHRLIKTTHLLYDPCTL